MIGTLLLYGTPVLWLVWLAGLGLVWRGRPSLSLWTTGAATVLGLIGVVSGINGPRHDNFWTGNAGSGDGFGLIGLMLLGAAVAAVSLVLLSVTAVLAMVRVRKLAGVGAA